MVANSQSVNDRRTSGVVVTFRPFFEKLPSIDEPCWLDAVFCSGKPSFKCDLYGCFSVEVRMRFHRADVSAGEGYECTVTVDDEDSKIVVFDNWKQVSRGRASCPRG